VCDRLPTELHIGSVRTEDGYLYLDLLDELSIHLAWEKTPSSNCRVLQRQQRIASGGRVGLHRRAEACLPQPAGHASPAIPETFLVANASWPQPFVDVHLAGLLPHLMGTTKEITYTCVTSGALDVWSS
jgi:hypothetical protein